MELILAIAAPIIAGIFLFVLRSIHARLVKLEEQDKQYLSKADIRELINDKVDDIRADVREIKDKLEKLFYLYLEDHSNRK